MAQSARPRVVALDHLVLTVTDIMTTCRFYEDVLGMTVEGVEAADGTTRWALRFGAQKINLHQSGSAFEPGARVPGPAALCFLSDTPIGDWQTYLAAHGVNVETGPVRRTGAVGPILSIFLRDPDGNLIEIGVRAE